MRIFYNAIIFINLVLVASTMSIVQAEEIFRLIVLDVGEGQAILLQRGKGGILIDTAHFGRSSGVVKAIKKYGVEEIDSIFLTHLHPDHASGIFRLMESFPDAKIYETGHRIPFDPHKDAYRWVAEALDSSKWQVKKAKQGDEFDWHGVKITILWPKKVSGQVLNSQSLVISATYGETRFLLMGDVGIEEEAVLLQQELLPQNIDVLVVGHHGAKDTSSVEFLRKVHPKYGVISVNKNNMRNYPDRKVLARLQKNGAQVHLTAEQGDFVWENSHALPPTN